MQDKQHVLDIKIDLDGQKKISKKKNENKSKAIQMLVASYDVRSGIRCIKQ